jgi:hypothetical protein
MLQSITFMDAELSEQNPDDRIWFVYDFASQTCTKFLETPDVIHPFCMCFPYKYRMIETVLPPESYEYSRYRHIAERHAERYIAFAASVEGSDTSV